MLDWISANIPPWVFITLIVHGVVLGTVAYLILLERKVASWVQDRLGPNRVGLGFGIIPFLKDKHMFGLGQPLADGLKFILKEDYRPKDVDKVLFTLAPMIMIVVIILSIAVIPWGGIKGERATVSVPAGQTPASVIEKDLPAWHRATAMYEDQGAEGLNVLEPNKAVPKATQATYVQGWDFQIANLNIGVLFVLGTLSLAVYGVVIGGWASNNKYSFLGGLRATANMISYEVPLGLSVLAIVLLFGTLDMGVMIERQCHNWLGVIPAWNIFTQPLAFLLFLVCIHAEANRAPFDVAEAEQELVGGYHTEYSSMRFALFFLAEYAGMITTSCVCVALFFGGWDFPGLRGHVDPTNPLVTDSLIVCILRAVVFFGKAGVVLFVFMWVRWSLPRFRFDQVMQIAWRALIPISLALVMATALVVYWTGGSTVDGVDGKAALLLIGMNAFILAATMLLSRIVPAAPDTNRRIRVPGSRYAPALVAGA